MEPSSTEGGAEETLLKNQPPSLVSADIRYKTYNFIIMLFTEADAVIK